MEGDEKRGNTGCCCDNLDEWLKAAIVVLGYKYCISVEGGAYIEGIPKRLQVPYGADLTKE